MIIFGTRGVTLTSEKGDFHCPQCASEQAYKYKKVRRFFTLYFIPIIPLDLLGEYVECQNCRGTFVPDVLDYDPNAEHDEFMAEYERAIRHSMVLMLLADGVIEEQEKITVLNIINQTGHHDMSMAQLEAYINKVQQEKQPVSTYLKTVAPGLNNHGKEMIIKCAYSVSMADGHMADEEFRLIQDMAKSMDMTSAHLNGVIQEVQKEKVFSAN